MGESLWSQDDETCSLVGCVEAEMCRPWLGSGPEFEKCK